MRTRPLVWSSERVPLISVINGRGRVLERIFVILRHATGKQSKEKEAIYIYIYIGKVDKAMASHSWGQGLNPAETRV